MFKLLLVIGGAIVIFPNWLFVTGLAMIDLDEGIGKNKLVFISWCVLSVSSIIYILYHML